MRIGIIGAGSMGKNHIRVVDSIEELSLTSVVDINTEVLKETLGRYSKIKALTDYREILGDVDSVMVSTPTVYHYEIAKFFLENDKNVIIEKPIAETVEQAEELIDIANNRGLHLAVGHLERFNPSVEYMNAKVDKPLFIEIQRLGSFSPRSLDIDVIMDLMIHDLDIVLNWDRSGVKNISVSGIPIISKKVDIANVRLEFNSGLVANITASRVSQEKTRKLRLFQKSGYFSLDYKDRTIKIYGLKEGQIVEIMPEIADVEPLYNLWMNFNKSVKTGENFSVSGEDAKKALELAIEIAERIKTK